MVGVADIGGIGMETITRGTTPGIRIKLPTGLTVDDVAEMWLDIEQLGEEIVHKTLDDMTAEDDDAFIVRLSQAETLKLCSCGGTVKVQARMRTTLGEAGASAAYETAAAEILRDGVI